MTEGINWGALMQGVAEALQPVPKGAYEVVVTKCDPKTSSTNKAMWAMQLTIEGGPHNGRVIFNNLTLTTDNPMALRMFFVNMNALGLDATFFNSSPTPQQIANALVGKRARVEIDHRDFQGQKRENVKRLMPATGIFSTGAGVPMPAGGPGVPGASPTPSPVVPPSPVPTPPVATPSVPAPQPVPAAPPATPAPVESTIPIPAPQAPAPPAEPESAPVAAIVPEASPVTPVDVSPSAPGDGGEESVDAAANMAAATPTLPPGMTPEMYQQFMAFQAAQNAAPAAATAEQAAGEQAPAPSPAPAGATPPPPPFPF